jgi:anti-sigma factor RsiW
VATSDQDDRELTAYLDGELDDVERAALDQRLINDPALRARLESLRPAAERTRLAFAALLDTAPIAEMRTRLDAALAAPRAPTPAPPSWRRRVAAIAAAAAIVAFGAGLTAGRLSVGSGDIFAQRDDWRQSVVKYMALYTPESFGEAVSPRLNEELASLSQRLEAPLDVDRLKVDDLSPRRAELLQYDGAPLGQIGYLDGATPVAFCILRDGEPDAAFETSSRGGFAMASWAQGGRGFMLIGKIPLDRLTTLARSLKEKAA